MSGARSQQRWRGDPIADYPPSPDGLSAELRSYAYPEDAAVASRVPTQDIEALLGYLPARATHSSLGIPNRPTAPVARSLQSRQGQVQSLQSALRGATAQPLWAQPQV